MCIGKWWLSIVRKHGYSIETWWLTIWTSHGWLEPRVWNIWKPNRIFIEGRMQHVYKKNTTQGMFVWKMLVITYNAGFCLRVMARHTHDSPGDVHLISIWPGKVQSLTLPETACPGPRIIIIILDPPISSVWIICLFVSIWLRYVNIQVDM